MEKNLKYYNSEYEKLHNEFDKKVEKLQDSFSLKEVCNMIIEDYNENYKDISFNEYFENECSLIEDFSYTEKEIYKYIKEDCKFVENKEIEKELLDINVVLNILNEYNDDYGIDDIEYDKIIVENNHFYTIKINYKMEIK